MHVFIKLRLPIYMVFAVSLFLCIANIWGYPITILDEAKNAEAAREMFQGNHWLPLFNDSLRTDKPPLHYFFMQLGYAIFGVNEFGARFFGALLGAGFMAYLYHFLHKYTVAKIANIALLILLSSVFWIQEFHLAVPDPYLIVFLCSAWLLFYEYYKCRKSIYIWTFYLFIGLATLSKGPVAIGLTGLNVILFLLLKKEFTIKNILSYKPVLGGLLVLLIAAPWFIWIHYKTQGAYTEGFFIKHNINRFSNEMEGHGGLFIITWLYVILGLFPFGTFIPQGLWHGWKWRKKNDLVAYCLVLSTVVIIFFSISGTKLPNYTLPAMPFLAILIAYFFVDINQLKNGKSWYNSLSLVLITIVALALPIAIFILFKHPILKHSQFHITIIYLLIIITAIVYIWYQYIEKNLFRWIYSIALLWIMVGLSLFYIIYPKLTQITPVLQASSIIEKHSTIVYKTYDPAFNINYRRNFQVINDETELIQYLELHPETLVLTKNKTIRDNKALETRFKTIFKEPSIFENYTTVILEFENN